MTELLSVKVPIVRTQILARIVGVSSARPVYDWIRNLSHQESVDALLKDTAGRLYFWQFGLAADNPIESKRHPAGENRVQVQWDIHGYMAVQDLATPPSEKVFDLEVLNVIDAFEANKKLESAPDVPTTIESGPAQRVQGGAVMLNSVLCHYARLSLLTVLSLEC